MKYAKLLDQAISWFTIRSARLVSVAFWFYLYARVNPHQKVPPILLVDATIRDLTGVIIFSGIVIVIFYAIFFDK
jgi:hypothetical protein